MSAAAKRPANILVVEDNPANQMLIDAVLQSAEFSVTIVSDATEALQSVQRQSPDLILLDLQLPGVDGLTLTRQLKSDPSTAAIPVVAVTAHAMPDDRQRSLDAGCVGYITKPYDARNLPAQIREFLWVSGSRKG